MQTMLLTSPLASTAKNNRPSTLVVIEPSQKANTDRLDSARSHSIRSPFKGAYSTFGAETFGNP